MVISELVIGALKPEVAQKGFSAIRSGVPQVFNAVPGSLSNHVGHIVELNGKDVNGEYKPILGLEWNKVEDFHAFYPASEAFKSFVGIFGPYAAAKATPQLFEPVKGAPSFKAIFEQGAARIFVAPAAAEKKEAVTEAWEKLLAALGKDEQWSGWSIGDDEGTWVGIVGAKSVEELGSTETGVGEALKELKGLSGVEEYVVSFA